MKKQILILSLFLIFSKLAISQIEEKNDSCPIYESSLIENNTSFDKFEIVKVDYKQSCCGNIEFFVTFRNYSGYNFSNIILRLTFFDSSGKEILNKKTTIYEYVRDGTDKKTISFARHSRTIEFFDKQIKIHKVKVTIVSAVFKSRLDGRMFDELDE